MRKFILAAALLAGTAAVAQPQQDPTAPPDNAPVTEDQATRPDPQPADAQPPVQPTVQQAPVPSSGTGAPNAQPMPPMEEPTARPMGPMQDSSRGTMDRAGMAAPRSGAANLPRCSRTVTDRCIQGGRRGR